MMKQKKLGLFYGAYVLSMLIFGTNGYPVSKMSLDSGQIVLMRTLIGGLLLTIVVLLSGGFDREAIKNAGYNDTVVMLLTNSDDLEGVECGLK